MSDAFNDQNLMTDPYAQPSEKGFELHIQLTWSAPLSRAEAEHLLAGFAGMRLEHYGDPGESRTVDLRRTLNEPDLSALEPLPGVLERVKRAEIGRRGFLRTERSTDHVPWRKNLILKKDELDQVRLEEGIRYVLE